MKIRALDRATGADCGTMTVDDAAARISKYFGGFDDDLQKDEIRNALLAGQRVSTVAYHYEITAESLAD